MGLGLLGVSTDKPLPPTPQYHVDSTIEADSLIKRWLDEDSTKAINSDVNQSFESRDVDSAGVTSNIFHSARFTGNRFFLNDEKHLHVIHIDDYYHNPKKLTILLDESLAKSSLRCFSNEKRSSVVVQLHQSNKVVASMEIYTRSDTVKLDFDQLGGASRAPITVVPKLISQTQKDSNLQILNQRELDQIIQVAGLPEQEPRANATQQQWKFKNAGLAIMPFELWGESGLRPEFRDLPTSQIYDLADGRRLYNYQIYDKQKFLQAFSTPKAAAAVKGMAMRDKSFPFQEIGSLAVEWMPALFPAGHTHQALAVVAEGFDKLENGSYQTKADDYTLNVIQFESSKIQDRLYDEVTQWFDPSTGKKVNVVKIKDYVPPQIPDNMSDELAEKMERNAIANWLQHIIDIRANIKGPVLIACTNHSDPKTLKFGNGGLYTDKFFEILTLGAKKAESLATGKPIEQCEGYRTDVLSMTCYNGNHADEFEKHGVKGSVFIAMNEAGEEFIPTRAVKTRAAIKEYLNSSLNQQGGISAYDFMITSLLEGGAGHSLYKMATGKDPEKTFADKHRDMPQMVIAGGENSILNTQYLATKRFQENVREGKPLFSAEEIIRLKANPVLQFFVKDIDQKIAEMEKELKQYEKLGDVPRENSALGALTAFSVVALKPINGLDNPALDKIRASVFEDKKVTPQEAVILKKPQQIVRQ